MLHVKRVGANANRYFDCGARNGSSGRRQDLGVISKAPSYSIESALLQRSAGNAYQIDAVPIAGSVGEVVPKVSAINRDTLPIGEHSHELPVDL